MKHGYDNAAFFYDVLARLVFGNKLWQAQAAFLRLIPTDARVLIVGGGSGWILEEMARAHPNEKLSITYVEAAPKMAALAQKRMQKSQVSGYAPFLINFITAPVEEAHLDGQYDVIITAFFFDNFSDHDAGEITGKLQEYFADDGIWLYTDFRDNGTVKRRLLLKIMYLFFGIICGVNARALPDMLRIFDKSGFELIHRKKFMNSFVESNVYIKSIT